MTLAPSADRPCHWHNHLAQPAHGFGTWPWHIALCQPRQKLQILRPGSIDLAWLTRQIPTAFMR